MRVMPGPTTEKAAVTVVLAEQPANGWGLHVPLQTLGYRVVGQAEDGETAVELTERLDPILVVMDTSLRGLSGLRAAEKIQGRGRRAMLLVASEWDRASLDAANGAGALACLVHPVSVAQLGLSAQVALARHAEIVALQGARAELAEKLAMGKLAVRAKGILMRRLGVGEAEAHLLLQQRARSTHRPLAEAIGEVLAADRFFADLERSLRAS